MQPTCREPTARLAHRVETRLLRLLFAAVLLYTAWRMVGRALA